MISQICRPHNLRLTLCPNCPLNNTLVSSLHWRIQPNRKKSWPCVFTCSKTNTLHISDSSRNSANNIATFLQPMSHYIFIAQSLDTRSLQSDPSIIPISTVFSVPQQASSAFKRLSELIKL